MGVWYLISVFIHVIGAAFWIGGMLFLPLIVLPGIKNNPERAQILYTTGIKFRTYGWIAVSLLIISGIFNMYFRGVPLEWEFLTENKYGKLLGLKLGFFFFMLIVGAIHDFYVGKKAIENEGKLKVIARWSGRISLLMAIIIAFLGVALSRGGI